MTGTDPRAGQEAARLLAAAQDWLRTSAPHLAPVADDGAPCSCPLCRAVAGLREADPDTVGRWVDSAVAAVTSLASQLSEQAARPGTTAADAGDDAGDDVDDVDDFDDFDDGTGTDDVDPDSDSTVDTDNGASDRQDGTRTRGLRRIPLERDEGSTSG